MNFKLNELVKEYCELNGLEVDNGEWSLDDDCVEYNVGGNIVVINNMYDDAVSVNLESVNSYSEFIYLVSK